MTKQKSEQQNTFLTAAHIEPIDADEVENPLTYAQTLNKQQKKLYNEVITHGDQESAEDFQTAMSLLNKYQKDKDWIKKDVTKLKE